MLQIAGQFLMAILTVIYAFQVSNNRIEQDMVPPSPTVVGDDNTVATPTRTPYNSAPTSSPAKLESAEISPISLDAPKTLFSEPIIKPTMPVATLSGPSYPGGIKAYYQAKIEAAELTINERTQNLRRLEAQRNALNARGAPIFYSLK